MTDHNALNADMAAWRHHLHANPEFGFEESRTAAFVAEQLRNFGLDEVVEGVGGTGIVGTLKRGTANRAIALRADMDALGIEERSNARYRSVVPGMMHACGHDGHTQCYWVRPDCFPRKAVSMGRCGSSSSRPRNGERVLPRCWPTAFSNGFRFKRSQANPARHRAPPRGWQLWRRF